MRIPPVIGLLLLSTALAGPARAFHDGGVGICEVCHVLHGEGGDDPVGGSAVQPRAEAACQLRNFRRDWLEAQFRRQARVGQPLLQRTDEKQF